MVHRSLSRRTACTRGCRERWSERSGRSRRQRGLPSALRSICCACVRGAVSPTRAVAARLSRRASAARACCVIGGAGGVADPFNVYVESRAARAAGRAAPHADGDHGRTASARSPCRSCARRRRRVLPTVDTIAVREAPASRPLLRVARRADSIAWSTTGDDAIELVRRAAGRHWRCGGHQPAARALGRATERDIDPVREGCGCFSRALSRAAASPLPIARQGNLDARCDRAACWRASTRRWPVAAAERALDTPLKVIRQVRRCRIVVTGAYHAAVFALAQGVPAIASRALSISSASSGARRSVRRLRACHVVSLDGDDLPARLALTMTAAWDEAPAGARRPVLARPRGRSCRATRHAAGCRDSWRPELSARSTATPSALGP